MPQVTDLRESIAAALADFRTYPLPEAAKRFFGILGYESERQLPCNTAREFCHSFDPEGVLTE